MRTATVGGLIVGICACGGGGGGSPNPVLGTGGGGSGSSNPVAGNLAFSTNENVALNGTLTATDPGGSAVTFAQTSAPASGTLTGFPGTGSFTYTPNANFTGSDSFGVTATDAAGNKTTGTVMITVTVNMPPVASNTIMTSDGTNLASINVLKNASDPDKDPLTVTILDPPPAPATASVNSDGTVNLAGVSAFKGLIHFTYKVTDPSGKSATAAAVIFIGTAQFRAAFVGDAKGDGSNEVYLTDFAAAPVVMTAATQGNLRLKGFSISDNGATIAYRTQDTTNSATTSLSFVQTATPTKATAIALPSGTVPVLVGPAPGSDQFLVSPDGQWIAVIAGQGSVDSLYVVNVTKPTVVSQIQPAGATSATQPTFSLDSKSIYFLASGSPDGLHRSLYFASLSSPTQTTLISAASDPAKSDEISAYSVSPDQTKIVLQANRNGGEGIYFVDASHLATETLLNETLDFGQSIPMSGGTTVGLSPTAGGSPTVTRVAYTVQGPSIIHPPGVYVADVSATAANPRLIVSGQQVVGLRPDNGAVMYTDGSLVSEAGIDVAGTQAIGGGYNGFYDSTGGIVLLQQHLPYLALASTSRANFGSTNPVGTTTLATPYTDVTGFQYGVAIIGQGPTSGSPPATTTLQLVNALAPQGLLPLASFQSPLQLTSYSSKVTQ
jgi:hypothetical protein